MKPTVFNDVSFQQSVVNTKGGAFSRGTLVFCVVALISGCAGSPIALSKMSPTELQTVGEQQLCVAYASYKNGKKDVPAINSEVERRGLACADELDRRVSNCSELDLMASRPDPTYSNVTEFTVRNRSTKTKNFLVAMPNNIASSTFTIPPSTTGTYKVAIDSATQLLSPLVGMASGGGSDSPYLSNCYTSG